LKNKNRRPNLYIIAGPNGAGKTTFALKFLPDEESGKIEILDRDLFNILLRFRGDQ